jgi:hypothetical protein
VVKGLLSSTEQSIREVVIVWVESPLIIRGKGLKEFYCFWKINFYYFEFDGFSSCEDCV